MQWEFKIITSQKEKDYWNLRFREEYDGNIQPYDAQVRQMMCSYRSKYIRIENQDASVGYARIAVKERNVLSIRNCRVCSLEEMLIEKEYRHNGAAAALIAHLRDYHDLAYIHVTAERAERLKRFHEELGFGVVLPHPHDKGMAYVYNSKRLNMLLTNHRKAANDNGAAQKKFMIPMNVLKDEAA
ncbi:GNAT family N-acetyltransferase [Sphingomonas lacunae]|uniref:GNAT family N-acetyltransferase n=1 Tax=Sphingomonas lacunae TaxID=2698828 RepID=A0A6M4AT92_9SPHN|nr:GNAT family N-acetyltransferase [Sphingomonas lacunae]QJQ32284.1 GNAT family N-acetyltransferase [Sphingomonas lacunae]